MKITSSPQYLHQNGKPVLVILGMGFTDHPPNSVQDALTIINYFKRDAGVSVSNQFSRVYNDIWNRFILSVVYHSLGVHPIMIQNRDICLFIHRSMPFHHGQQVDTRTMLVSMPNIF